MYNTLHECGPGSYTHDMNYVARVRDIYTTHKRLLTVLFVACVSVTASFVWGYALGKEGNKTPIIIETRGSGASE